MVVLFMISFLIFFLIFFVGSFYLTCGELAMSIALGAPVGGIIAFYNIPILRLYGLLPDALSTMGYMSGFGQVFVPVLIGMLIGITVVLIMFISHYGKAQKQLWSYDGKRKNDEKHKRH
ncbi:MAG: hypothetical protein Phog2KO_30580 [Phototrophicaceae bacterium]